MDAAPDVKLHFEMPYSRLRIFLGYLAAAVTSFFLSLFLMTTSDSAVKALSEGAWPGFSDYAAFFDLARASFFPVFAVVGTLIAAIVVGAIGIPVWQWFASRGRTGFVDALLAGAMAGAIIGAVELFVIAVSTVGALGYSGGARYAPPIVWVDHELADYWVWIKVFLDIAHTIAIGALSGLAARAVAGPAKQKARDLSRASA